MLWFRIIVVILHLVAGIGQNSPKIGTVPTLRLLGGKLTSIHFIGDLHSDVRCAKHWVEQTKLVNMSASPLEWLGSETDALVFLGDYVDKGSTASSVLKLVKSLQESFPDNVVSILGNHDFFQLLDTALYFDDENPHPLDQPVYDYSYSFVHPGEYLQSGFISQRPDNDELMGSILSALQTIYANNLQSKVMMCAPKSSCKPTQLDMFTTTPPFDQDSDLAERARKRLEEWRKEYAQGLLDSGLLAWMASRPLLAIVGDALVVHGGVSGQVLDFAEKVSQQRGISVSSALHYLTNIPFGQFWEEQIPLMKGGNSVKDRLQGDHVLGIILDMVQHRGYFNGAVGCKEVRKVIDKLDGVKRVVVGHTPRDFAEELCKGSLLASDSSLSTSFRAYGNYYCPLEDAARQRLAGEEKSGKGDKQPFVGCRHRTNEECGGSISRISRASSLDPWPSHVNLMRADGLFDEGRGKYVPDKEL